MDTESLFGLAFVVHATRFVLVHNHPNTKALPSPKDLETIKIIKEMSKVTRKKMLDFIIIVVAQLFSGKCTNFVDTCDMLYTTYNTCNDRNYVR